VFDDYPFVLSQVLPHPIVVVQGRPTSRARPSTTPAATSPTFFSQAVTGNVALLELKTPSARLLGAKYRPGVHLPSGALVVRSLRCWRNATPWSASGGFLKATRAAYSVSVRPAS